MLSRLLARPKGNLPLSTLFSLLFLLAIFLSLGPAQSAQVTLAWDPSTDADLQGYKVYYGMESGAYVLLADVGMDTHCTVDNLQDGLIYYFAATAYNSSAESDYSNEVRFVQATRHTIAVSAGEGGSIAPSGTVTVSHGDSQTFTVTVNNGYEVADVLVDGLSQGALSAFALDKVTTDHTVQVAFTPVTYTLAVATAGTGSGTVAVSPHGSSFASGTIVTLTALAASGSTFSGWSGACSGITSPCALAMTSNITTTASFAAATYTITASSNKGGSILPSGTTVLPSGASQTYSIAPASGYSILDVKVDGVSIGKTASYTFGGIAANHQIQAAFGRTASTTSSGKKK